MRRSLIPTYKIVHQMLRKNERGACLHCGNQATEWAMKHDSLERLTDVNGRIFSSNIDDYEPLCVKCHRRADRNSETMWNRHYDYLVTTRARGLNHVGSAKLTLVQVTEIKNRLSKGETGRALSEEFKVSEGTISMIKSGQRWNGKLQHTQRAFTLIEVLIVVAIISILAAVSLPAYQDYVTRAKVTELILAADSCKLSITEYWQSQAAFPPDMTTSGCIDQKTQYVASVKVGANGVITVTGATGPNALDVAAAGDFVMAPSIASTGQLVWDCKTSTIPKKYLPSICR